MTRHDYNGTGKWTVEAVQTRYAEYAARLGITSPLTLSPMVHVEGETKWTYPIMQAVIDGIRAGDPACSTIGVEFIEEDRKFTFGRALKSTTARALRQTRLPHALVLRIQRRIVDMLLAGNTPREFREYAKLLRKVGFEAFWPRIQASIPRETSMQCVILIISALSKNVLRTLLDQTPRPEVMLKARRLRHLA